MGLRRRCSKPSCDAYAIARLTYVYSDSTVVLGPMGKNIEPHSYDLCQNHADQFVVPKGWETIRLEIDPRDSEPNQDDLEALADVVREVGARVVYEDKAQLRLVPPLPDSD